MKRLVLIASILTLLPAAALAQVEQQEYSEGSDSRYVGESPRHSFLEFNGGQFFPKIDQSKGLTGTPYADIFGQNRGMWIFGIEYDYDLINKFGNLCLGFSASYGSVYSHGLVLGTDEESPDPTSLKTIPLSVLLVYRFDWLLRKFGVPLVPFGKAGPAYTFWWSTNGDGDVATFNGNKAEGGKWGYQLAGGLAFELNFIDPALGRELDREYGINSVFLQAQYVLMSANNFGKTGIDLSGHNWSFGLGFDF